MTKAAGKQKVRADQLRPLNLPLPVKVVLDSAGLPARVSTSCEPAISSPCPSNNAEQQNHIAQGDLAEKKVESILEIWRVEDEWWREPISRQCVEVILEGGKHVVLHEDLTNNNWYMQRP